MTQGLGTQLRHLIELLDNAVQNAYRVADIADYRPRFTPVMRVLSTREQVTIGEIADIAGITQPAATQTVALMQKNGLIVINTGDYDGRRRMVSLSTRGKTILPLVAECWCVTKMAADGLDAELEMPLSRCIEQALAALATLSFDERIRLARDAMNAEQKTAKASTAKKSTKTDSGTGRTQNKKAT